VIDASAFVIVLTTFPADGDVAAFARALVDERLAACVNVLPPMESTYRWQGAVERASERQVIMKTTAARLADLNTRIAALHPYDVPELLVLPLAGGGDRYLKWVRESVADEG
jgi:periplasmic divalent cation tolerance protein